FQPPSGQVLASASAVPVGHASRPVGPVVWPGPAAPTPWGPNSREARHRRVASAEGPALGRPHLMASRPWEKDASAGICPLFLPLGHLERLLGHGLEVDVMAVLAAVRDYLPGWVEGERADLFALRQFDGEFSHQFPGPHGPQFDGGIIVL